MNLNRSLLTTKAVLANRVTFVLSGESEFSVQKLVAGRKVDGDQWHFPIRTLMGIFMLQSGAEACVILERSRLEAFYKKMKEIPNVPTSIGPVKLTEEMIVPGLYNKYARQRFPQDTEETA